MGAVTKNRANSLVAYILFISNVRFDRTLHRGWLVSVSSPLVLVVSATGKRDVDGPWLIFSSTSSRTDYIKNGDPNNYRVIRNSAGDATCSLVDQ